MTPVGTPPDFATEPFTYDAADLRALNFRVTRWWTPVPSLVAFALIAWVFGSIMLESGADWTLLVIMLALLALFAGPWTWRPFLTRWWLRRQGILKPQIISIKPEWLLTRSERGEGRLLWSAVIRIKRTRDRLFIFSSKAVAHIIPRRAFLTDSDFDRFTESAQALWEAHREMTKGTSVE